MSLVKAKLLIVDDEPLIRLSMSHALAEIGFEVRCAGDGIAALGAIREAMPDILITDLNMPGMSGFELLSVVRRRLPHLQTIAMSGSFSGNEVPSGVTADAFYQKGSSLGALLQMIGTLSQAEPGTALDPGMVLDSGARPLPWAHLSGKWDSAEDGITIACPECLRSFPVPVNLIGNIMSQTDCLHCGSSMQLLDARFSDQARRGSSSHGADSPIAAQAAPNLDH